jgi:hypothetical protein
MALLMEADVQLHPDNAGLIFTSRAGYRRLHPRPDEWERMTDPQLEALCDRAKSIL